MFEQRCWSSCCGTVGGLGGFEGIAYTSSASVSPSGDGWVRLGDLVVGRHFSEMRVDGVELRREEVAMNAFGGDVKIS